MTFPSEPLDGPLFSWTAAHAVAAADITLARLRALDITVPDSNRLAEARRLVDRVGAGVGQMDDAKDRRRLEEAHRTIAESYLIVRALGQRTSPWFDRLDVLMSGAAVPEIETHTTSRDLQFELLVAAVMVLGGVLDLHRGEPDLRIRVGAEWLGIAVKRATKSHKLRKQIGKAIRQVQEQGILSLLVIQADWPDRPPDSEELNRRLIDLLADQLPRFHPPAASGLVLGAILFATSWEWHPGPHARMAGMTIHTPAHFVAGMPVGPLDEKLRQLGRNLFNAVGRAIRELDAEAHRLTIEEALALGASKDE